MTQDDEARALARWSIRMIGCIAVIGGAVIWYARDARAEPVVCQPWSQVKARFEQKYHEVPVSNRLANGKWIIQVLASPNGETFTVFMIDRMGIACAMASGTGWEPGTGASRLRHGRIGQGRCRVTTQVKPLDVQRTVHPMVALAAKRDDVVVVEAHGGGACPRLDMMGVNAARPGLCSTAVDAAIIVSGVDGALHGLPFGRRVKPLPLWRAAVAIVGIGRACAPAHSVSCPTKVRLLNRRFTAEHSLRLGRVRLSRERVHRSRLAHVVVATGQVETARPRGDAEVLELFVDPLRIAPDKRANLVGRKAVGFISLPQPSSVQMQRFHMRIVADSVVGAEQ